MGTHPKGPARRPRPPAASSSRGGPRPGVPHDDRMRALAFALFEAGHGYKAVSTMTGLPRSTVREWGRLYRTFGMEARERSHGGRSYPIEVRLAAARDVVEGGMPVAEAARRNGVRSDVSVSVWAKRYRAGGEQAVREGGGPRGRPPASGCCGAEGEDPAADASQP